MAKPEEKAASLREDILTIKRERILTEAVELFYKKGYLPTNVDEIAQQLGATKPFVYYHFKSKIDLLSEVCRRVIREALEVTEAAAASDAPPVVKLEDFVRRFTDLVLERHKYTSIYFREQLNLPEDVNSAIDTMRKKIDYRLRDILREGQETGDFDISNLAVASQIVSGMISYTFAWYHESGHLQAEDIRQPMLKHVLLSVGVAPEKMPVSAEQAAV